jgi:hypothetical protein
MPETFVTPKCGAKKTDGSGDTCKMPAGYGTGHPGVGPCKHHFGATPMQEGNHARVRIKDAALVYANDQRIDIDRLTPIQALKAELVRAYLMVEWLENETDTEMAMWPVWQDVLLKERKHLVDVAARMIHLGIEERQIRILESQAEELAGAVRTILDRIGLTPDQARRAPILVREVIGSLPTLTAA